MFERKYILCLAADKGGGGGTSPAPEPKLVTVNGKKIKHSDLLSIALSRAAEWARHLGLSTDMSADFNKALTDVLSGIENGKEYNNGTYYGATNQEDKYGRYTGEKKTDGNDFGGRVPIVKRKGYDAYGNVVAYLNGLVGEMDEYKAPTPTPEKKQKWEGADSFKNIIMSDLIGYGKWDADEIGDKYDPTTKKRTTDKRLKLISSKIDGIDLNLDAYDLSDALKKQIQGWWDAAKNAKDDAERLTTYSKLGLAPFLYTDETGTTSTPATPTEEKPLTETQKGWKTIFTPGDGTWEGSWNLGEGWHSGVMNERDTWGTDESTWANQRAAVLSHANDLYNQGKLWDDFTTNFGLELINATPTVGKSYYKNGKPAGNSYYYQIPTYAGYSYKSGLYASADSLARNTAETKKYSNAQKQRLLRMADSMIRNSDGSYKDDWKLNESEYILPSSLQANGNLLTFNPITGTINKRTAHSIKNEIASNQSLQLALLQAYLNLGDNRARYLKETGATEQDGIPMFAMKQGGKFLFGGGFATVLKVNSIDEALAVADFNAHALDSDTERNKWAANKHALANGLSTSDRIRAALLASDVVGTISAFVPGGFGVSAGAGIASSGLGLAADLADDSVSGWDVAKNLGTNLGMTAISFIPGLGGAGKGAMTAKNLIKFSLKVLPHLLAAGMLADENVRKSWGKLTDGKVGSLKTEDWKNIVSTLTAIAGSSRAGRALIVNRRFSKALPGNGSDVAIKVKGGKRATMSPETLAKINEAGKTGGNQAALKAFTDAIKAKEVKGIAADAKLADIDFKTDKGWKNAWGVLNSLRSTTLKGTPTTNAAYVRLMESRYGKNPNSEWSLFKKINKINPNAIMATVPKKSNNVVSTGKDWLAEKAWQSSQFARHVRRPRVNLSGSPEEVLATSLSYIPGLNLKLGGILRFLQGGKYVVKALNPAKGTFDGTFDEDEEDLTTSTVYGAKAAGVNPADVDLVKADGTPAKTTTTTSNPVVKTNPNGAKAVDYSKNIPIPKYRDYTNAVGYGLETGKLLGALFTNNRIGGRKIHATLVIPLINTVRLNNSEAFNLGAQKLDAINRFLHSTSLAGLASSRGNVGLAYAQALGISLIGANYDPAILKAQATALAAVEAGLKANAEAINKATNINNELTTLAYNYNEVLVPNGKDLANNTAIANFTDYLNYNNKQNALARLSKAYLKALQGHPDYQEFMELEGLKAKADALHANDADWDALTTTKYSTEWNEKHLDKYKRLSANLADFLTKWKMLNLKQGGKMAEAERLKNRRLAALLLFLTTTARTRETNKNIRHLGKQPESIIKYLFK